MYKSKPHELSKCRKKINLDVANFLTKTEALVSSGISGLVPGMSCRRGVEGGGKGRGEASWGVGKCRLFLLRLPVLKFVSIRTKPALGVKEDQRMLTVNPSLYG